MEVSDCKYMYTETPTNNTVFVADTLLSAAERRGTPVLLSASVSDNFGNSPQIAAPRRSREIDQSTQRFYVGWFHVGWQGIGDQSDAVTQNAWFRCALCAPISGEISILIQTGAESWGRFPVPRICCWESTDTLAIIIHFYIFDNFFAHAQNLDLVF